MSSGSLERLPEDVSGRPVAELLAELAAVLRSASKILIATHVSPDGDAIGSSTALALGLRKLGKEARVFSSSDVEQRFAGIIPAGMVELVDEAGAAELQGQFDLCVLLDTSEISRAGVLGPVIFAEGQKRICIDHHLLSGEYSYDAHLVLAAAPATACLVLSLLEEMGINLEADIARALWLALATDTGWFRFANAGRIAFQCAERLLETGLDTEDLYGLIYGSRSPEKTRLWGRVLDDHKLELEGRLVWSAVSMETMEELGTVREDLDGAIDILKGVRGAHVAALVSQLSAEVFKVSLRSVEQVDVEEIARGFGGGGHAKAAGYTASGPLDGVIDGLREVISSL